MNHISPTKTLPHGTSIHPADITGLILAGGQGRRMGYRNKGLQLYKGAPLISHVISRLRPQVGALMISANTDIERYAQWGYPIVQDTSPTADTHHHTNEYQGPLAGIYAALRLCPSPYLAVSPCDAPDIPIDFVHVLSNLGPPSYYAEQPLLCLLPLHVKDSLGSYLQSGGRKVKDWWASLANAQPYTPVFSTPIMNINTLSDLV